MKPAIIFDNQPGHFRSALNGLERVLGDSGNRVIALIGLLGFWFLLRPFNGFYHDSLFYAFEAISRFTAGLAENDLFSKYFNQGAVSLFPILQSWLIRAFGLWNGTYILFVLSQVFWFCSAYYFARAFFTQRTARFIFLLCLVTATGYYLSNIFRIDEPFVTARSLAEPLTLLSLAELLKGRAARCVGFGLAAAAMHPIVGIWGPVVLAGCAVLDRMGLWFFFRLLVIAVVGIGAAAWLLDDHRHEVWLNIVMYRKAYLFPFSWGWSHWDRLLQQSLILLSAVLLAKKRSFRNFYLVLLGGSIACILVTVWGDFVRSVWLIKVQAWRIHYVAYIVALAVTVDVALRSAESSRYRLLAFVLIMSWASRDYAGSLLAAIAVCAVLVDESLTDALLNRFGKWLLWLAVGAVAITFVFSVMTAYMWYDAASEGYNYSLATSQFNTAFFFLFALLIWGAARWIPRSGFAAFFILGVSVSYAFNARPVYDASAAVNTIQKYVKRDEIMYWPGHLDLVWLDAHRPFYYATAQLTPSIFSEAMFDEGLRRYGYLVKAGLLNQYYTEVDGSRYDTAPLSAKEVGAASWQHICSDPVLKWVVMLENGNDHFRGHLFKLQGHDYKLISCETILAG